MRYALIGLFVGIIFGVGTVIGQEPPDAQCLNLAKQFSEDPDSLAIQELERLRFCVIRALEHREQSLEGEFLKGTIIHPPSHSDGISDKKHSTAPKN